MGTFPGVFRIARTYQKRYDMREFEVRIKKDAIKGARLFPDRVLKKFRQLLRDLRQEGPFQPKWPNYSKLGPHLYHCHLDYSHVACWELEKDTILIEVYYVGSRQSAPY
jgi:hypothetical protein